jgi:hypothetical protein
LWPATLLINSSTNPSEMEGGEAQAEEH